MSLIFKEISQKIKKKYEWINTTKKKKTTQTRKKQFRTPVLSVQAVATWIICLLIDPIKPVNLFTLALSFPRKQNGSQTILS